MKSHKGDVHALAVHPHLAQFISGSLDCSVSVWDAETHQVIWTVEVEVSSMKSFLLTTDLGSSYLKLG